MPTHGGEIWERGLSIQDGEDHSDEDLSADNNASGLKKAIFLQALGRRDKNVKDFENAKQYMYVELFSMISEESKGATDKFWLTSGKMPGQML